MKKSVKKSLFVGTMAALTVVALGACSPKGSQKKAEPTSEGAVLQVSVAKGYTKFVDEIKEKFEKDNQVTVKVTEKDMFEQLEALPLDGPAGKAPDVMMSAYDRIGVLGTQGHLAEVTLGNAGDYDETDQRQVTSDGKIYGAPAVIETLVLFYNKDLLPQAPKTFQELEQLAKDSKYDFPSEAGKNTGFLAKWTDFYFSYGLISGYGGYVFGDNGKNPKDIGLNNAGAIDGITYATNWFQNVWPKGMQDIKSAGDFVAKQFMDGKAAAIIDGPWQAAAYKESGVNYGVAAIPTLVNGKGYQSFGGGKGWIISNYSKQKELAQKWLDYVTNKDNQVKFYEMTNEVPANQAARKEATAKNDEITNAVIAQYKNAQPMPNIPEMGEVWVGAENLMFDAASGTKTPKQSADDAVMIIKEAIEQKY